MPESGSTRHSKRRPWLAGCLAVLLGTTGCAAGPDRKSQTQDIQAALRALPGVVSVDGNYVHSFENGDHYALTVQVAPDLDQGALATIGQTYEGTFAAADLDRYDVSVTFRNGDYSAAGDDDADTLLFNGDRGQLKSITPVLQDWGALAAAAAEPVSWGDSSHELRLSAADIPAAVTALRSYPGGRGSQRWELTVGPRGDGPSTIQLEGGLPSDELAVVLSELTAPDTGETWSIVYDSAAPVPLVTSVTNSEHGDTEPVARRHLQMLASTGLRIDHTERPAGEPAIAVSIGGCRSGGSATQQRLNQEFGTC